MVNWGLRAQDEECFVADVLAGQPEPPAYCKEMKRINKAGPTASGGFVRPPRIAGGKLQDLLDGGEVLADIRSAAEIDRGGEVFANRSPLQVLQGLDGHGREPWWSTAPTRQPVSSGLLVV